MRSVVAAVPNFDMAGQLRRLLPDLLHHGYDRIVVLDDGSTDDSAAVCRAFAPQVELVAEGHGTGAAGNRNRILQVVDGSEVIHFIDADMTLVSPSSADVVRRIARRSGPTSPIAFGGLFRRGDGSQDAFNCGPSHSVWTQFVYTIPVLVDRLRSRRALAS